MKKAFVEKRSFVAMHFMFNLTVFVSFVFITLLSTSIAFADLGDKLHVGAQMGDPTTFVNFVDNDTAQTYTVGIRATEDTVMAGVGKVTFILAGRGLAVGSAHGPQVDMQLQNVGGGNWNSNSPVSSPLQFVQIGTAQGQNVSIKGCVADLEFHGYVHSDAFNVAYMGMATIDVRYQKSSKADEIHITIHTPKEAIKLSGKVVGSSMITSCQ